MKKKKYNCPAEMALDQVGGKWKIILLWNLRKRSRRFGELKRLSPGISPMMLTQQLRALELSGFVTRRQLSAKPLRVEYTLTEMGQAFKPALYALVKWGLAHQEHFVLGEFGMREVHYPRANA